MQCAPSTWSAAANICRELVAKFCWLKTTVVVQRFAPITRRRAAVGGRMIADMQAELGDSAWTRAATTGAGLDWFLDVLT